MAKNDRCKKETGNIGHALLMPDDSLRKVTNCEKLQSKLR